MLSALIADEPDPACEGGTELDEKCLALPLQLRPDELGGRGRALPFCARSHAALEPRSRSGAATEVVSEHSIVRGTTGNSAQALRIEAITDFGAFLDLHDVWDRLVNDAEIDHPFLSHDWIRIWWECFGKGKQLHILLVKNGRKPVALIPLMYSSSRMYGLRVRQLEFFYNSHTPRCDFIISRGTEDIYGSIWRYLREIGDTWDIVKLPQLPADSQTVRILREMARKDDLPAGCWPSAESPYLTLTGTWDDYFGGLNRKHRSNIRNRLGRLQKLGNVEREVVSTGSEIALSLEAGLDIEAMAWKGRAGTAILCHPDLLAFYQKIALKAAEKGWLRLNFLTLDGRKIAFDFSLLYKKNIYLLKPGYDPEFAPMSPYNSLCYLTLKDAFESGVSEYDFLGMKDDWKLNWTGATRPHVWMYIFSDRLRTSLLHYAKFRLLPELHKFRLFRMLRDASARMFNPENS
jgi:CelD/BcsL family acetyltransferase involved in cellulose biosynthesis